MAERYTRTMRNSYRKIQSATRCLALLAYPPPYRCWLTVSNDPDGTTIDAWRELHQLIWEELKLPLSDSFILRSFNENQPGQVNLQDNPEIISAHHHDTIHAWGDYHCSRTRRFSRDDAIDGLQLLSALRVRPLVWTDHACMSGNVLHNAAAKMMPVLVDATGHPYENFEYSVDLIHKAGVRYVWDGSIEPYVFGQDRTLKRREWYGRNGASANRWKRDTMAVVDHLLSPASKYLNPAIFSYHPDNNRQYQAFTFPDGSSFYTFRRYGRWELAEIGGFGKVIAPEEIRKLIASCGTAIVYTHLGKPPRIRDASPGFIPVHTREALKNLAALYNEGTVNLSSTSHLLDYLVLRDHAIVADKKIDFRPDGIRFATVQANDLKSHTFGVYSRYEDFNIACDGTEVGFIAERVADCIFQVRFY
jgi:hypothetical protein